MVSGAKRYFFFFVGIYNAGTGAIILSYILYEC